ncbi:hypothetical protein QR98_0057300 [Sarcoptes scabiei]|uniref:Uncharacterized protein n=1 Tax=Sarcoptes scabiei TaxID=52283 RepID=A0A132A8E8_SARSC|nr:hypothetical protein QR98_0057300 [Sarcoptes scabiei]
MSKVEILFQVIRFILVILFSIIFIISTIYFIRAIDAIGDDVEEARETHFGHEIEENDFLGIPINPKFDPYEDYEANPNDRLKIGRLVKKNRPDQLKHPHYRITNSRYKQQHIVSLIIWVVLTLFCAILSLAGVLGALFLNPCMVLFSAIMILVHAVCSHILPIFHIQFPSMTSNWFLLALEVPTITAAILYVVIYRARQRYIRDKINRRTVSKRKM